MLHYTIYLNLSRLHQLYFLTFKVHISMSPTNTANKLDPAEVTYYNIVPTSNLTGEYTEGRGTTCSAGFNHKTNPYRKCGHNERSSMHKICDHVTGKRLYKIF